MTVKVRAVNPRYQTIRLAIEVAFRVGEDANLSANLLQQALRETLSPWAYDTSHAVTFGGSVCKSQILALVESLPYVDYLRSFRMYTFLSGDEARTDVGTATALAPDVILVSDDRHDIKIIGETHDL